MSHSERLWGFALPERVRGVAIFGGCGVLHYLKHCGVFYWLMGLWGVALAGGLGCCTN